MFDVKNVDYQGMNMSSMFNVPKIMFSHTADNADIVNYFDTDMCNVLYSHTQKLNF